MDAVEAEAVLVTGALATAASRRSSSYALVDLSVLPAKYWNQLGTFTR
jgi:hypothetical protein